MILRFSARGDRDDAIVHLTVVETLRFGSIVRVRGEALCRPKSSLPNLDLLNVQRLDGRKCCPACVDWVARIRIKRPVVLPASAGVVAGDLIRQLKQEREAARVRVRRSARTHDSD